MVISELPVLSSDVIMASSIRFVPRILANTTDVSQKTVHKPSNRVKNTGYM